MWLYVDPSAQTLSVLDGERLIQTYVISTGAQGLGEIKDSGKTPRGWHTIRAKIGEGAPLNAVFRGRRFTQEIYSPQLAAANPERDWILTRILWLSGLQPGFNRLGNVDTMQRYIYIHGAPDEADFTHPSSKGCIRMRNQDVLTLFNTVAVGTRIYIGQGQPGDFRDAISTVDRY